MCIGTPEEVAQFNTFKAQIIALYTKTDAESETALGKLLMEAATARINPVAMVHELGVDMIRDPDTIGVRLNLVMAAHIREHGSDAEKQALAETETDTVLDALLDKVFG